MNEFALSLTSEQNHQVNVAFGAPHRQKEIQAEEKEMKQVCKEQKHEGRRWNKVRSAEKEDYSSARK